MEAKAVAQLAAVVVILTIGCVAFSRYQARPKTAGQLQVSVSELRSTASECAMLCAIAPTEPYSRAFRNVHLEMVRSSAQQALKQLETARVRHGLEALRDSSTLAGHALVDELSAWGSADRSVAREAAFQQLSARLQSIEHALE